MGLAGRCSIDLKGRSAESHIAPLRTSGNASDVRAKHRALEVNVKKFPLLHKKEICLSLTLMEGTILKEIGYGFMLLPTT